MKKQSLLILMFLFALASRAQNCFFSYSFTPGTFNVVAFTPSSSFSPNLYHFEWNFGDGNTSSSYAPTHTYNSLLPVVACCDIYDSSNVLVCSYCDSIVRSNTTSCTFSWTQTSGLDVLFDAPLSTGFFVSWSFDHGLTWISGNPYTYVFPSTGTYDVCMLKVDSLNGDTVCNVCNTVTVSGPPNTCDFNVSANPGNGLDIYFTSNVALFSSIFWDFGDGASGTGRSVSHIYSTTGTYNVCMYAVDTLGDSCFYCQPVTAGSTHGNCWFAFNLDTNSTSSYFFWGLPSFPGSVLSWDFGDGSTQTGTNVGHTYNAPGAYTVCMNESDSMGNVICSVCQVVPVGQAGSCYFNSSPNPFHSFTIDFQANSGLLSTVTWDFGDGSGTDTGQSVSHTFPAAGIFNVCITVNTPGTPSCSYCDLVIVSGGGNTCAASFISTTLGLTAYFIDMSAPAANSGATYSWDFGDNSTSTARFPQHTYNQSGSYNVCLTVAAGGCTDTYCSLVRVDSTIINPVGCQAFYAIVQLSPFQVTVVNLSSGVNLSFNWDYGDGSSDTQPFPSHVYASTGIYNLCLTVADGNGCTSTYCDTLAVDSLGNIFRAMAGFSINVVSPSQLTGVNEIISEKNFSVFPNPVTSDLFVNLKTGTIKVTGYRILSLPGSEILRGELNGFEGTISMKDLTSGTYLLELTTSDGSRGYKTIIKN